MSKFLTTLMWDNILLDNDEIIKPEKFRNFKSVKKMREEIKKEEEELIKKHPVYYFLQRKIWWNIIYYFDKLLDIVPNIKYFIQRGIRGWSVRDTWSIDYYHTKIMIEMLTYLRDNHSGHPCILPGYNATLQSDSDKGSKIWYDILNKMIRAFEIAHNMIDCGWIYVSTSDKDASTKRKTLNKQYKNQTQTHIMNIKECKEYEKGWKLFQEYYFRLWD